MNIYLRSRVSATPPWNPGWHNDASGISDYSNDFCRKNCLKNNVCMGRAGGEIRLIKGGNFSSIHKTRGLNKIRK